MMLIILASPRHLFWLSFQLFHFMLFYHRFETENKTISVKKRIKKIQQLWSVDSDLQNARSPYEYICETFLATPPLPWDSFQCSDWNPFSCLLLTHPTPFHSPPFSPVFHCFFPRARIRRNFFRSNGGGVGLMASESSIFSHPWRRILNLSRICPCPGSVSSPDPGSWVPGYFAFPH